VTMMTNPNCFQDLNARIMSAAGMSVRVQPRSRRLVTRINPPNIAMHARCVESRIGYTSRDSRTAVNTAMSWTLWPTDARLMQSGERVKDAAENDRYPHHE
jgi:hypothetical protein